MLVVGRSYVNIAFVFVLQNHECLKESFYNYLKMSLAYLWAIDVFPTPASPINRTLNRCSLAEKKNVAYKF